ncbi:hypothetical protein FRC10_001910 [Ceratobasidium sp. 414]|nr:hypothetical protein FRC10_001910 [Ceratobasidium sp. 414]
MDAYLGWSIPDSSKLWVVYDEDEDAPFHPSWQPGGSQTATGQSETGGGNSGDGDGVNMGGRVNENSEPDDEEEGEDEDQQHLPGRMQTAADARQHVVYPNPTLSITQKLTVGHVRGLDIIAKYRAVDFVPALHAYLNIHGTQRLPTNFLPTAYHEYPVWHHLYLRHDVLPFDPEWPWRDVLHARLESKDQDSIFNVALLLQDREHGAWHAKVEL